MSKLTISIVAAALLGLGALAWYAARPTGHSMDQPDLAQLSEGAAIVDVTVPAEFSDNAKIGQRAFEAKCAACHGTNAAGQNGVAPPLVHKIYEPSHHGDMAFVLAAKNGVRAHHWRFGDMPPVEGLTQGDAMMIVAYVRELQQANGID
ncbi:MAG: cytochrome c [Marinovum algicola]|jgi:cytochrome c|uniref:Cytochrome c n=1 Tax=Marinovum algicola TaxID=42444 RepID=A0A975ZNZ3_9RHOB|nr:MULTISPECIES: cytochrome c [Marinovum]AKO99553.1 Cytochrome c2 [Marinovum algicola DG 898]MDD9743997.1 cytochrome c [Marinovum sp. PR37]SEJ71345.1 Cytochrome c [Marinovum algicola]SLN55204.1 Cytochrome c [Marinovum algicola]